MQHIYFYSLALKQAGALDPLEAAEIAGHLIAATVPTTAYNPFTNVEGPLKLLALDLRSS